jgi:5-methylcytosine-specific restriction endonuclease McrA
MLPTSDQLPLMADRIIGEVPYDVVAACIPYLNVPIMDWPKKKIQIDLPDGQRVRFQQKQFHAIKNPVCVHCGERGIKFLIVSPPRPEKNPNRNCQKKPKIMLVTQHDVLLTRDHIHPKCKGGDSHPDNIQVLCETCNNHKSKEDCH